VRTDNHTCPRIMKNREGSLTARFLVSESLTRRIRRDRGDLDAA
jgi:hypothetical protein